MSRTGRYLSRSLLLALTAILTAFFSATIFVPQQAHAATIYSFKGPEKSPDSLLLTDFMVTGNTPTKVGDFIRVSFSLSNATKTDISLADWGILVRARSPSGKVGVFGYTGQNRTLKPNEKITLTSGGGYFNEQGTWVIWPSYHIRTQGGTKYGPDEWHACRINAEPKDTSQGQPPPTQILPPPGQSPDLIITQIKCDTQNNRIGYVIQNTGSGAAPRGHVTALYMSKLSSRIPVAQNVINIDLNPGANYEAWFQLSAPLSGEMEVCADIGNQVKEANENNNCLQKACQLKDDIPPVVNITYSPTTITTDSTIRFTARATDNVKVAKIQVFINGQQVKECSAPTQKIDPRLVGATYWECEYTGGTQILSATGSMSYEARAVDSSGNEGGSGIQSLTLVQAVGIETLGSISVRILNFPYDPSALKIEACQTNDDFSACIDSPSTRRIATIDSDHYDINRLPPHKYKVFAPTSQTGEGNCPWQGTWEPRSHNVELTSSRNTASVSFTFTPAETTRPSININIDKQSPSPNESVNVRVTATDASGIARIRLYQSGRKLDRTAVGNVLIGEDTNAFLETTIGPFPDWYVVYLQAVACDRAGNQGVQVGNFLVGNCHDEVRNRGETDVDCGGPCPACDYDRVLVSGRLSYEKKLLDGTTVRKPVRFVEAKLGLGESPGRWRSGLTDNNGNFAINVEREAGEIITMKFEPVNYAVKVWKDLDGWEDEWYYWEIHIGRVPSGGAAHNIGEIVIGTGTDSDPNSQILSIADTILTAREYADTHRGDDDSIGRVDVEYPDSDWPHYTPGWEEISLRGENGWEDATAIHEYGHHLEHEVSQSESPGGGHSLCDKGDSPQNNANFAWSEGFANYFAHLVIHKHLSNTDPKVLSLASTFYISMEDAAGCQKRDEKVEGTVMGVLWDLYDAYDTSVFGWSQDESFDQISGYEGFPAFDTMDSASLCSFLKRFIELNPSAEGGVRQILKEYSTAYHRDSTYAGSVLPDGMRIRSIKVDVDTGNISHAGTDANVYLVIGDYGYKLDNPDRGDHDRGDTGTYRFDFDITSEELKNSCIKLYHDNSGDGPGWYVARLRISYLAATATVWGVYKEWNNIGWLAIDSPNWTTRAVLQEGEGDFVRDACEELLNTTHTPSGYE